MAWSLLQTTSIDLATGSVALSNTTSGSLVLVAIATTATTTVSAVSCAGMSFAQVNTVTDGGSTSKTFLYYAYNITGNTTPTLSITSGGGVLGEAIIREYSGSSSADPLDKHVIAADSGASTSLSSGATATQSGSNNLVIGYAGEQSSDTYVVGAGYGNLTQASGGFCKVAMEDKTLTGDTSAQTATFTTSANQNWGCGVATFQLPVIRTMYLNHLRPAIFKPGIAR